MATPARAAKSTATPSTSAAATNLASPGAAQTTAAAVSPISESAFALLKQIGEKNHKAIKDLTAALKQTVTSGVTGDVYDPFYVAWLYSEMNRVRMVEAEAKMESHIASQERTLTQIARGAAPEFVAVITKIVEEQLAIAGKTQAAQNAAPTGQNIASAGQKTAPAGQNAEPTKQKTTPFGKAVSDAEVLDEVPPDDESYEELVQALGRLSKEVDLAIDKKAIIKRDLSAIVARFEALKNPDGSTTKIIRSLLNLLNSLTDV